MPISHVNARRFATAGALAAGLALAFGAGTTSAASSGPAQNVNLAPTKTYLLKHTSDLRGFTKQFRVQANRYFALAKASRFDHAAMWRSER